MPRRTHIQDVKDVVSADDLERVVRDKREAGRAHKRSVRRNRHYRRALLRHLVDDAGDNSDSA